MAIKAECPVCHRKQAVSNKLCECGQVEGYRPRPFGCEVGSHFHHRPRFPRPLGLLTTQVAPTAVSWRDWAAVTFTSEHLTARCLTVPRIC